MHGDNTKSHDAAKLVAVHSQSGTVNGKPTVQSTRQSIEIAFEQHQQSLLRYCRYLTRHNETAEEIVQETFARLCGASTQPSIEQLKPWLFKVCRNQVFDQKRKDRRIAISSLPAAGVESKQPTPDEAVQQSEAVAAVMQRVNQLPENQQEVLRLRFMDGLCYREVAEVIDSTVSNVGVLLHTAMKTLRLKLSFFENRADEKGVSDEKGD